MTVSEQAVVRAIRQGASNIEGIQAATGAEMWWIQMNVFELLHQGLIVGDLQGRGLRVL